MTGRRSATHHHPSGVGATRAAIGDTVLRARGVTWRVGERALVDSVDLDVAAGEVLALIGPNGAGKSTLCRVLSGDLTPADGTVELFDRRPGDYGRRDLARLRAVLPQKSSSMAFPCVDIVLMGRHPWLRRSAAPGASDLALALAAMEEVGVVELAAQPFDRLSGGEQARVHLARVLVQDTPLLLLDEPTASLDLHHQHLVADVVRRRAASGVAVVAVLHDLALASAYADTVLAMDVGRAVAYGRPDQILTGPVLTGLYRHPVTIALHPTQGWAVPLAERHDSARRSVAQPASNGHGS